MQEGALARIFVEIRKVGGKLESMRMNPDTLRSLHLEALFLGQAEHLKEIIKHPLIFKKLMLEEMVSSCRLLSNVFNSYIVLGVHSKIKSYEAKLKSYDIFQ